MSDLRNVMVLYREDHDSGDPWGSATHYLFRLAEILDLSGECPPEYRPSPLATRDAPSEYGEDAVVTDLWDALQGVGTSPFSHPNGTPFPITLEAVHYAFVVLSRYRDIAEAAGHSY